MCEEENPNDFSPTEQMRNSRTTALMILVALGEAFLSMQVEALENSRNWK